jgi:hypothetical protein
MIIRKVSIIIQDDFVSIKTDKRSTFPSFKRLFSVSRQPGKTSQGCCFSAQALDHRSADSHFSSSCSGEFRKRAKNTHTVHTFITYANECVHHTDVYICEI